MRRYQLVIGGTAAGIAGVLAFPTHGTHLTLPSASAGTTTPAAASSATTAAPATSGGTSSAAAAATTTRSATSSVESFRYGDLSVTVTASGSKITAVKVASLSETDGRSASIDQYAIPQLEQQVISAGSADVDGVSGATFTSQAFVDAVSNAMSKLGLS